MTPPPSFTIGSTTISSVFLAVVPIRPWERPSSCLSSARLWLISLLSSRDFADEMPACCTNCATAISPRDRATARASLPLLSSLVGSAPASSSSLQTSKCPLDTARIRGTAPDCRLLRDQFPHADAYVQTPTHLRARPSGMPGSADDGSQLVRGARRRFCRYPAWPRHASQYQRP